MGAATIELSNHYMFTKSQAQRVLVIQNSLDFLNILCKFCLDSFDFKPIFERLEKITMWENILK